jgi:hypothetical protein
VVVTIARNNANGTSGPGGEAMAEAMVAVAGAITCLGLGSPADTLKPLPPA